MKTFICMMEMYDGKKQPMRVLAESKEEARKKLIEQFPQCYVSEAMTAKEYDIEKNSRNSKDDDTKMTNEVEQAYENGLHDAWEIAKKIECMDGYDNDELIEMFGTYNVETIFGKYKASEALDKVKAYEEQKEKAVNGEIKVGDEIIVKVPHTNKEISGIVCKIGHADTALAYYCISFTEGHGFITPCYNAIKKTGRHFPGITNNKGLCIQL